MFRPGFLANTKDVLDSIATEVQEVSGTTFGGTTKGNTWWVACDVEYVARGAEVT